MQVYFIAHLCFGMFIGGGGAVLLSISLLAAFRRKKFKTYEDQKAVYSSIFYTLCGANGISSAFDPPHQASQRTDILFLVTGFVLLIILYFGTRCLAKNPTL